MCHPKSSWQDVSLPICGVTSIADAPDKELKFTDRGDISKNTPPVSKLVCLLIEMRLRRDDFRAVNSVYFHFKRFFSTFLVWRIFSSVTKMFSGNFEIFSKIHQQIKGNIVLETHNIEQFRLRRLFFCSAFWSTWMDFDYDWSKSRPEGADFCWGSKKIVSPKPKNEHWWWSPELRNIFSNLDPVFRSFLVFLMIRECLWCSNWLPTRRYPKRGIWSAASRCFQNRISENDFKPCSTVQAHQNEL